MFEIEEKRDRGLENLLNEINKNGVNVETIWKGFPLGVFLAKWDIDRITREAGFRAKKFMVKRGRNMVKTWGETEIGVFEGKMFEAYYLRLVLDHVLGYVLGYYGVSGARQLIFRILGYSIAKTIKEKTAREWVKDIEQKIRVWKTKYNEDEDLLKAVAMISAMVSFEVRKQFHS